LCRNESRELISQLRSISNFDCDLYYLSPLTTTFPLLSGNIGRWRHDLWTPRPNIQSVVLHREVNPFHFTSIDTFVAGIQRSCVNLHDRACNSKCSITCRYHLSFQLKVPREGGRGIRAISQPVGWLRLFYLHSLIQADQVVHRKDARKRAAASLTRQERCTVFHFNFCGSLL
jgi:hypothetical protein